MQEAHKEALHHLYAHVKVICKTGGDGDNTPAVKPAQPITTAEPKTKPVTNPANPDMTQDPPRTEVIDIFDDKNKAIPAVPVVPVIDLKAGITILAVNEEEYTRMILMKSRGKVFE
jgi:hypothetical protein